MQNLRRQLKSLLSFSSRGSRGAGRRAAIMGIGSELRGDDAAGLLVLKYLQYKVVSLCRAAASRRAALSKIGRPLASRGPTFKFLNGGTAPENLTGEIRRFCPTHLIMLDAVDMGKRPGALALIDVAKDENGVFLTHKLPVKLMLDYMGREMNFVSVFIGIQPKTLEFGAEVSRPVALSCERLANLLAALMGNPGEIKRKEQRLNWGHLPW